MSVIIMHALTFHCCAGYVLHEHALVSLAVSRLFSVTAGPSHRTSARTNCYFAEDDCMLSESALYLCLVFRQSYSASAYRLPAYMIAVAAILSAALLLSPYSLAIAGASSQVSDEDAVLLQDVHCKSEIHTCVILFEHHSAHALYIQYKLSVFTCGTYFM